MLQSKPSVLTSYAPPGTVRDMLTPAAAALVAELSSACEGPAADMPARIMAALRRAVADPGLLAPEHRVQKPDCYARHVISSDPAGLFTVMALVWGPGQFSPVHGHHTWCAYAVCDRGLMETIFDYDTGSRTARPVRTAERPRGYACFSPPGLDQIHRLGNAGSEPAISIHVYGVDRDRICTHVNRLVDVA
jgi:predicted metal-dependent enzyme (double-stranded beta helix superfamily)